MKVSLIAAFLFLILSLFCACSLFTSCASCNKDIADNGSNNNNNVVNPTGSKMKINIGNSTFTATLHDNATAAAFINLLPLTVKMVALNANEKYA
jgi:hypothetical protein